MRKKKIIDDTPEGGWLAPRSPDKSGDTGPIDFTHYATDTKMVRGIRVWNWKPITEGYLRKCEKRRDEIAKMK